MCTIVPAQMGRRRRGEMKDFKMARLAGIEPATLGFGGQTKPRLLLLISILKIYVLLYKSNR